MYLSLGYTEMAGSDMWWHVAAGRELCQTGTLFMVDDWSYTEQGRDWWQQEWLSDVIYFIWADRLGVETLVYWKWLVIIATFTLLQLALARSSGSHLAGFICAGVAVAIAAPFLDVRPHLYTLLNFCLLLYLLLRRRPVVWLLVLQFVIWVNLHGGFFFGLMALGILLFPWSEFSLASLRSAFLIGLACLLAAALNPSGFGTFFYPLKYAFDESSPFRQLAEWLPPSAPGGIRSPLFFVFQWAPVLALLYAVPQVRKRTGVPWEGIALTGLTLAMALTSRRFIPLFAISLAVLLAPLVGLLAARLRGQLWTTLLAGCALLIAGWRMLPYPLQAAPAFHYLVAEYNYPVDLINFTQANGLRGRVFAYYNWGGYLHWRTDGALKVYIDGRADTLYDAQTYNNYVAVMRTSPDWIARVEATGAEYVMWPHGRWQGREKLRQLLGTGRWRALYRDSQGWLAVRVDVELPEELQATRDSPWRQAGIALSAAEAGDLEKTIEHAERALRDMPWQQTACSLRVQAARALGREEEAQARLADCRAYFPSGALR